MTLIWRLCPGLALALERRGGMSAIVYRCAAVGEQS
jgi:hypothetical protein